MLLSLGLGVGKWSIYVDPGTTFKSKNFILTTTIYVDPGTHLTQQNQDVLNVSFPYPYGSLVCSP